MQQRFKLILEGLDCANCALKIENGIKGIDGINNATVNFSNKTMMIESDWDKNAIIDMVREAVMKLEPGVTVLDKDGEEVQDTGIMKKDLQRRWIRLIFGIIPFIIALLVESTFPIKFTLFLVSYFAIGVDVLKKAVNNITKGQIFDENFLMAIATIGAFIIGEYPEGVAVLLFYQIGELFQDMAVHRSRKSIANLMDIRPDFANLKKGEQVIKVSPTEVKPGDVIVVRPGEKVPMDGYIIEGQSTMDTSALTGESIPRDVKVGDEVLGGFINTNGLLWIEVSKPFGESTVSKILDLVENAGSKKAPTENFITRFARYYTPFVVFLALAMAVIPPLVMPSESFSDWIYRALIFLVISCPCALVISIPLSFFGGIGGASRRGILVKGGNFLEAMTEIDTVIFDKTGTLTKGIFAVTQINPIEGIGKSDLLHYAALGESHSTHPIAKSILHAYSGEIDGSQIKGYREIPGHGIVATTQDQEILAGNEGLMQSNNIEYKAIDAIGTIVYIAVNGQYMGNIVVSDELKTDAKKAVAELKGLGVKTLTMLTGDTRKVGEQVARELGLDKVYSQLLPHEKVEKLEAIAKGKTSKGKLVFVGDGINDAPVLARADVGIAMGGLGSDAAIEAADIVLMTDEPQKIVDAVRISRKTRRIVWQNIALALGVKGIVLLMGAIGLATMWEAVFADVGVALLAVLNSMRVIR
ncbi:MAG TPA: cadmium-translocating P-type ATPase [Clostridiales bacterium]|nr:cadmium-translocating P-type ATPase [Clostridiales bacterium]